jgi:hypothetical protein
MGIYIFPYLENGSKASMVYVVDCHIVVASRLLGDVSKGSANNGSSSELLKAGVLLSLMNAAIFPCQLPFSCQLLLKL